MKLSLLDCKDAIDSLPDWCDKDKVEKALWKWKKLTCSERNCVDFIKKIKISNNKTKSSAFKVATQRYFDICKGPNVKKRGDGFQSAVEAVNNEFGTKLNYQSVLDAVNERRIGVSLPKKGQP